MYAIAINLSYWIALYPELKQLYLISSRGELPGQERVADFLGMGKKLGRALDRYGGPAWLPRLRSDRPDK